MPLGSASSWTLRFRGSRGSGASTSGAADSGAGQAGAASPALGGRASRARGRAGSSRAGSGAAGLHAEDTASQGSASPSGAGPSRSSRGKRKASPQDLPAKSVAAKRCKDERPTQAPSTPKMSLYVRWYSPSGKTKVNHLALKHIDGVDGLEGISKDLVMRAFPADERPDYITSPDFYRFTPVEEFMNLPGDIARTEFRLVVTHEGWEYTVLGRELGAHRDPERKMLVTVIEFESTALMIGRLGVTISLIAYPVISVKKTFLDGIQKELETNPDFKGIL